jgi:hypothetical protein
MEERLIKVEFIKLEENMADIFTKYLSMALFNNHKSLTFSWKKVLSHKFILK